MRRLWAALLLTLPALGWASSFDADSFDSANSFSADSFDFVTGVCGVDDNSPIPGGTINVSGCPAFAGAITTLTSPGGDTITAEAGASTTAATFIIPALSAFVSGQAMQDTEWDLSGTWTVGDGSTTENLTLRIDPPDTDGPDYWFGTVTTPIAGDSVFPPTAAPTAGDEYFVERLSGTNVLVNSNGSTSADDDYSVRAVIWDESANGGLGQWSAAETTEFDSTPPAFVSAVIAANGTTFTLTLDEAATQGAGYSDSHLTFSMSGGAVTATYASGNGTTAHVYTLSRTVEAGETGTVSFSGANSLEDAVGNDVSFSAETVTNNSGGDVTPPQFSSASIPTAGTSISAVFNEAVTRGAGYSNSSWVVTASGGAVTVTYASGDGTNTHVLTTSRTIGVGETVQIRWTSTVNGLEDAAGNDLAGFSNQSVTNNSTADVTAPAFSSASVPSAGTSLSVVFTEAVTQGAGYADGDWTVTASGGAVTLTYSSGDTTDTHVFTTSRTIEAGETISLAWAGTSNGLEDAAGNDLASFSGQTVTNGSTQDLTAPLVVSARIITNGTQLRWQADDNLAVGAGGSGGAALTCSGGAVTPTFSAIVGSTAVFNLSRTVASTETCTTAYTQPTDGFEDTAGNDLATFSGTVVSVPADCAQLLGSVLQPVLGPAVHSLQCAY